MKLEWDETKRQSTLSERGMDFADVENLDWSKALTIVDTRSPMSETRYITAAPLRGRLCIAVWCQRGDTLRVISFRKANKREEKAYGG